jgi:hypothetical protein
VVVDFRAYKYFDGGLIPGAIRMVWSDKTHSKIECISESRSLNQVSGSIRFRENIVGGHARSRDFAFVALPKETAAILSLQGQ